MMNSEFRIDSMKPSRILCIVILYNAEKWIDRCLGSLYSSTIVPDVYVVDNGSKDSTLSIIREKYNKVILNVSKENLGFGKANNIGLKYAYEIGYEYVYLLNQDAWVLPNTFEKLIEISSKYPEYGILSPIQMNADLLHIDRYFNKNVCNTKACPDLFNDLYNTNTLEVYPAKNVMAAHWLITNKCLSQVGGFSPSFPHYGEDANYEDRIYYWGFKMGIVPSLRVVHDRGERKDPPKKMIYLMYTSCIRELSRPNYQRIHPLLLVVYKCIQSIILYKSLSPILYVFKLLFRIRSIYKNRLESINCKTAFLY